MKHPMFRRLAGLAGLAGLFCLTAPSARAVILFGLDNNANQSDPGTGAPFGSVARVFNGGTIGGSAVHVGNGWMLTANHVGPFHSTTFDGVTNYAWDGAAPIQLGTADMKLFRLASVPTVPTALIYGGTGELVAPATVVGWGVGRDPNVAVNSNNVAWGGAGTSAKRWGINIPKAVDNLAYNSYSYQAIYTFLGSGSGSPTGVGANEAAATLYDSGGGLFQQIGGDWYLIGITAAVEGGASSLSVFGNDQTTSPRGYFNAYVRVSNYESGIMAIIPEPGVSLLAGVGLLLLLRRRPRG